MTTLIAVYNSEGCQGRCDVIWGTSRENAEDRARLGTQHRGSRTGGAKLTDDLVRDARRRRAAGETVTAIALEYDIRRSTLSEAISGRKWGHVA